MDEEVVHVNIPNPGSDNYNEELSDVQMSDNPAYQDINRFSQENVPHIYERVTF